MQLAPRLRHVKPSMVPRGSTVATFLIGWMGASWALGWRTQAPFDWLTVALALIGSLGASLGFAWWLDRHDELVRRGIPTLRAPDDLSRFEVDTIPPGGEVRWLLSNHLDAVQFQAVDGRGHEYVPSDPYQVKGMEKVVVRWDELTSGPSL